MSDAVKVGFVPFSTASRGILVIFCDDTLKFGPATGKALGDATGLVKRAAATNQFKGKSGSTLDILAPEGLKASRLIVVGAGKISAIKANDFLNGSRQTGRRDRRRDDHRGIARWSDEAGTGGRGRGRNTAARL